MAEHCRLDRRTIQRLENGELRSLSLDKADQLARGLGVRTGSLFGPKAVARRDSDKLTRETLAENLVRAREKLGWTQEVLAERSGVSRPAIAHIERHARNPDLTSLVKLADTVQMSVERLLGPCRTR